MSLVKIYLCDVCDKQMDKRYLYRFKMKEKVINDCFIEDVEDNFDICTKCYKKIVKQIRKECD